MKTCTYPFEYLYLDSFDGKVWSCPWMDKEYGLIGNMFTTPIMDIWHGEKVEKVRRMVAAGDFSCCRMAACPFLQNNTLPDSSDPKVAAKLKVAESPRFINLAHDYICNQSCETCRPHKFVPPAGYRDLMLRTNEIIGPLLDKAEVISLSGHGDPFASPYMMRLLQNLRPQSPSTIVQIETNGVLFTPKNWQKIAHLATSTINVIITVNSFDEFTYNHLSRGGNYAQLMKNLEFVSELRKNGRIKQLMLAMVIQDRNFREMPSFVNTCLERYTCDKILLRPVYQWGTMAEDVFWFKDVLNPLHPYHPEYLEVRDHPALTHPKVWHFGGRTLHPARPYPAPAPATAGE